MVTIPEFLKTIRAEGPWTLSAIPLSAKNMPTRYCTSIDQVIEFVQEYKMCNLYIQVNLTRKVSSKARIIDIESCDFITLDVDKDSQGVRLTPDKRLDLKARMLADKQPPSIIIDTGGGIQAFWKYEGERPDIETAGRINEAMLDKWGGDKGTWSPAQLMRLPCTINRPNDKKRSEGRSDAQATVIHLSDATYQYTDFPMADERAGGVREAQQGIGEGVIIPLADLVQKYNIPAHCERIIEHGYDPEDQSEQRRAWTRSEWIWRCLTDLFKTHIPANIAKGILLNRDFKISEKTYDPATRRDPDDFAEREINNAKYWIDKNWFGEDLYEQVDYEDNSKPARLLSMSLSEFKDLPPPEWIIDGIVQKKGMTLFFGPQKQYKTYLSLHASLCIASGSPFHDRKTSRGKVLYLIAEGIYDFASRVRSWVDYHNKSYAGLDDHFRVIPRPLCLDVQTDYNLMAKDIEITGPYDLIVIDTVARTMAGDENSSQEVNKLIKVYNKLMTLSGSAILAIHHSGKGSSGARGSTALPAAVDGSFKIAKDSGGVKFMADAVRAGPDGWSLRWDIKPAGENIVMIPASMDVTLEEAVLFAYSDNNRPDLNALVIPLNKSVTEIKRIAAKLRKDGLLAENNDLTEKGLAKIKYLIDSGKSFKF